MDIFEKLVKKNYPNLFFNDYKFKEICNSDSEMKSEVVRLSRDYFVKCRIKPRTNGDERGWYVLVKNK